MGYIKHILILFFLYSIALSCVEPYEFRSIDFEKAVVVEGRFTDQLQEHYVKLSFARDIEELENVPLTNATAWIQDGEGSRIDLIEADAGLYKPNNNVAGIAGGCYQLFFTTNEGRQYQSAAQELLASPPIDSIYSRYAEQPLPASAELKKGIQFFVDTHDETNNAQYYRYEWAETYEVRAHYPSYYEFSSNPDTALARLEVTSPCYVSAQSIAINVATTANLTISRLSEMPIRFITHETDHLRFAYSLLVRQYVISAEAYGFYRKILENNNGNRALFDKQLGAVAGNITSLTDPEETVLGFFEVSGASEHRAFFQFQDLDKRFPMPVQENPCPYLLNIETVDSLAYYIHGKGYALVDAAYKDGEFKGRLAPGYCTDCRFRGPAVKPDFWIY